MNTLALARCNLHTTLSFVKEKHMEHLQDVCDKVKQLKGHAVVDLHLVKPCGLLKNEYVFTTKNNNNAYLMKASVTEVEGAEQTRLVKVLKIEEDEVVRVKFIEHNNGWRVYVNGECKLTLQ